MATLLTRLDQQRLDAEREIVKNERRLRVDNQPFGVANEVMSAALFPSGHPYSWPVIGSMADLSAASVEDVKDFFRTYYAPNNAVIVLSGDFRTADAKRMLGRYFGAIPRGPAVPRPAPSALAAPPLAAAKYVDLEGLAIVIVGDGEGAEREAVGVVAPHRQVIDPGLRAAAQRRDALAQPRAA